MTKFKVGDIVIANESARGVYSVTRPGWIGKVVEIDGKSIKVRKRDESKDGFWVDPRCFDKYSERAAKFKVGDIVIGNHQANRYGITVEGWKGYVVKIDRSHEPECIYVNNTEDSNECQDWVNPDCFDLFSAKLDPDTDTTPVETSEPVDMTTMTRAEIYSALFGCSHTTCPTGSCENCPSKSDCGNVKKWWNSPIPANVFASFSPKRAVPERNAEHTTTKKKGLAGLCEEYNYSDSAGLKFIADNNLCTTDAQKATLEVLLLLNELIYVYNSETHRETEYRARYTALLRELGLRVDREGVASVRGETK